MLKSSAPLMMEASSDENMEVGNKPVANSDPGAQSSVGRVPGYSDSETRSQTGASGCVGWEPGQHVRECIEEGGSKFSSVSYSSSIIIFPTSKSRSTTSFSSRPHRRACLCSSCPSASSSSDTASPPQSSPQGSEPQSPSSTPPALLSDSGTDSGSTTDPTADFDSIEAHAMAFSFPPNPELANIVDLTANASSHQHQQQNPNWDKEKLHWRMPGEDDQGQAARAALYEYPDVEDSDVDVDTDVPLPSQPTSPSATQATLRAPQQAFRLPSESASSSSQSVITTKTPFERPELGFFPSEEKEKPVKKIEWDWSLEHADRAREARMDAAGGVGDLFQVDRKVLRDTVKEKMGGEVVRIRFISSGTFHKAYLVTLSFPPALDSSYPTYKKVIFRAARRFMPRLKTSSEVATLKYLREHTNVPVPEVYAWDSNPYSRVGGEWILMSRAPGIPLRKVYHSLPHKQLITLLSNLAHILIPLFGHRFSHIGSLYEGKGESDSEVTPPKPRKNLAPRCITIQQDHHHEDHVPTPTAESAARARSILGIDNREVEYSFTSGLPTPTRAPSVPMSLSMSASTSTAGADTPKAHFLSRMSRSGSVDASVSAAIPLKLSLTVQPASGNTSEKLSTPYHIGPIISWPFFGSHRGDLNHASVPPEIDRGPWGTSGRYFAACVEREVKGVERENEGRAKPHRLHLDPDEVRVKERGRAATAERGRAGGGEEKGKKRGKGEYIWGYGYVRRTHLGGGYGMEGDSDTDSSSSSSEDEPSSDEEAEDSDSSDGASPARSLSSASASSLNSDDDEDTMYRDYRRYQRTTFLVAELSRREKQVRSEMGRWERCMKKLEDVLGEVREAASVGVTSKGEEMFGLDCHDLSLDNVFVDERDPSKITCVIDWESTTTRPLWACAHLPSFLLASPFASGLFRKAVAALPKEEYPEAFEWLLLERAGAPLRYAHKCAEWDGWEDGLVNGILGEIDNEEDAEGSTDAQDGSVVSPIVNGNANAAKFGTFVGVGTSTVPLRLLGPIHPPTFMNEEAKEPWQREDFEERLVQQMRENFLSPTAIAYLRHPHSSSKLTKLKLPIPNGAVVVPGAKNINAGGIQAVRTPNAGDDVAGAARRLSHGSVSAASELEMERMLDVRGDVCGGRGGELGRRLEAWLFEVEDEGGDGTTRPAKMVHHDDDRELRIDGHANARVQVS